MEKIEEAKKVLIAGIEQADNQFVRAVESYGLIPIHFGPNNGNGKNFPDADAAIVVTSFTSHKYYWAVKDKFKEDGKRVFLASQGFSEIKQEFEEYFLSDLKKNLDSMKWNSRMYYMLGHFFKKPGTKFKLSELEFKIKRFYPDFPTISSFIQNATDDGTIERKERGKYIFKGLSEKRVSLFKNKYKIEVPIEWKRLEVVSQQPSEEVLTVSPVEQTPVPMQEIQEHKKTNNEDIALLLSAVSDLDNKVQKMTKMMDVLIKVFNPNILN